ncbi:MAG: NAD-dependent epimerase/dehydratase family protein [Leptospiraceae bacterium]|nr:SDR family oxidoreductase [Leptospiraceae bacterium]MCK6380628.1 NAD-dependent epimerase/dehydratase family protein [Leptospiraceae bacterium]NUM41068.1 SDR family oxidoreductase [Leptospiraceae bacterium]
MRVLVTGDNGFISKNLISFLKEKLEFQVFSFSRDVTDENLDSLVKKSDFIFHLAGVNRPKEVSEFKNINVGVTEKICKSLRTTNRKIPIVFSSSIQAELNNDYGQSKLEAEKILLNLENETGSPVFIFRMPNVFGKWSKPNYNSVVATFCYNISHDLPIQINNPETEIILVYIDDVVEKFYSILKSPHDKKEDTVIHPQYKISLGELAKLLYKFRDSRKNLVTEKVGCGFVRSLYSTYMSYLEPENFKYTLPSYTDERGEFVEMLKTTDSGQFSFFTAKPGVTRGGHYHHTKTEKFLVIKGKAKFGFRHLITNENHTIYTSGDFPEIVETIPGWVHDITNVGEEEMIVMLWANEIFDRSKPDTYSQKVLV